jgi:hypothetical protein
VPRAARKSYTLRAAAWRQLIEHDTIDTVLYTAKPTKTLLWDISLLKGLGCNVIVQLEEPFSTLFARQDPRRYSFVQSVELADAAVTETQRAMEFWQSICPTYLLPVPDAQNARATQAGWQAVLGAVRSGEGNACTRREAAYMRDSKMHRAVRLWLKCKDKAFAAVQKIRRKLHR